MQRNRETGHVLILKLFLVFLQAPIRIDSGEPETLGEGLPGESGQGQGGVHPRRVQEDRPVQKCEHVHFPGLKMVSFSEP